MEKAEAADFKVAAQACAALESMWHEITSQLASHFRLLVVTDLRRLTASAQSVEPSLGVADFLKQLSYKMHWRGGELNFAQTPELLYGCSQCGVTQTNEGSRKVFAVMLVALKVH